MTRGFSPPASGLATMCQPPEALEAKQSQVALGSWIGWPTVTTLFLNDPFLQPICCATNARCAFYQMLLLINHTRDICSTDSASCGSNRLCALLSLRGGWCGRIPTVEHGAHASRSPYPGLSPLGEERRDGERRRRLGAVLRRRRRASGRRARRECASPRASLHAASGGERESVSRAEDGAPTDPARSRVYPPTFPRVSTHDAPLTANSRGLHHPPAAFAALSVFAHFFSRGDLTRAFFRGEGAFLNRKIHR